MASNYKKPPIFSQDWLWSEKDLKSLEKKKFQTKHTKTKVHIYGGKFGMEFLLAKTIPEFLQAANKLKFTWQDSYDEFEACLDGPAKIAWQEVLLSLPLLDCKLKASFSAATDKLIKKLLNNNSPRDQQWIYLSLGSNQFHKKLTTPLNRAPPLHP